MVSKKLKLTNLSEKYENPFQELVRLACTYRSDIALVEGDKVINAKSIMGIMAFVAGAGEEITVEVEGPDQTQALGAMVRFLSK